MGPVLVQRRRPSCDPCFLLSHTVREMLFITLLCYLPFCLCQLTWEKLPVRLGSSYPAKRRDAGLGYDISRNILVLFGGKTANKILNDTWVYNISSGRWREVFGKRSPAGRFSFVYGVSKGRFYIAMGEGRDSTYYNDVWVFTVRSEVWEPLPLQPKPFYLSESEWSGVSSREFSPEPRYGTAGGIFPGSNHLYVSLGCSKDSFFDTATYDIDKHSWHSEFPCYKCTPYTPAYPHPRCLHSGLMTDTEELVVFGGCLSVDGSGGPCPAGDSWLFDGKRKSWERLDNCVTPSLYSAMALLPISAGERRVVLYGGKEQSSQVVTTEPMKEDEIGILNPGTRKWTIRKTTSDQPGELPRKRGSMSMVTGEEGIYMFGGFEIDSGSLLNDVWLLRGDSVSADGAAVLECSPQFFSRVMVHGILMAIGWGGLLVWGALVARYLRHKHMAWLYVHITLQVLGLICGIAGLIFGVLSVESDHFTFSHGIIGLVVTVLGILQPFNALIQPSRHTDMVGEKSVVRVVWEWTHHVIGFVSLILGLINISLGIFLALSGYEIWIIWGIYLSVLVIICLLLEGWRQQQHHHHRREERFNASKVETVDNTGVGNSHRGGNTRSATARTNTYSRPEMSRL